MSHPRGASPPQGGQRWRPGGAGSAAFWDRGTSFRNESSVVADKQKSRCFHSGFFCWENRLNYFSLISL